MDTVKITSQWLTLLIKATETYPSAKKAAADLGIAPSQISRYLNGRSTKIEINAFNGIHDTIRAKFPNLYEKVMAGAIPLIEVKRTFVTPHDHTNPLLIKEKIIGIVINGLNNDGIDHKQDCLFEIWNLLDPVECSGAKKILGITKT